MAISEQHRFQLHQRLEQVLGPDEAATLMEHLPPLGWADVATKHDVAVLRSDLDVVRAELGVVRADLDVVRADVAVLRSDLGVVGADLAVVRADLGVVRGDLVTLEERLNGRLESASNSLRAEFQRDLRLQLLAILGFNSALVAATYAVARFA